MSRLDRRALLRAVPPGAAALLAGCLGDEELFVGDPILVHRLEAERIGVSRVDAGWRLRMELGWTLEQDGMMTGQGISDPAVVLFDATRDLVDRRPVDLPLTPYEDCEFVSTPSETETPVASDGPSDPGSGQQAGFRSDPTETTTCPLLVPITDETVENVITIEQFPHWISFAFDRVETAIDVVVYEYVGPRPPPDSIGTDDWDGKQLEYPSESDAAPLPGAEGTDEG